MCHKDPWEFVCVTEILGNSYVSQRYLEVCMSHNGPWEFVRATKISGSPLVLESFLGVLMCHNYSGETVCVTKILRRLRMCRKHPGSTFVSKRLKEGLTAHKSENQ